MAFLQSQHTFPNSLTRSLPVISPVKVTGNIPGGCACSTPTEEGGFFPYVDTISLSPIYHYPTRTTTKTTTKQTDKPTTGANDQHALFIDLDTTVSNSTSTSLKSDQWEKHLSYNDKALLLSDKA